MWWEYTCSENKKYILNKIKIGIIGYGSWVKDAYLPALKKDGRGDIIAIAVGSEATAKSVKKKFGDSIDIYIGFEKLLQSPEVDAVMIAVPDSIHAKAIEASLESGKAVFYEPPIAHTRTLIPEIIKNLS